MHDIGNGPRDERDGAAPVLLTTILFPVAGSTVTRWKMWSDDVSFSA